MLEQCPCNEIIGNNLVIAWSKINSPLYRKILCCISGGADSDIVLDICWKCDINNKIDYVWFDTGLEYQATKNHLKYLENKYGIKIKPYKAIKPIPLTCKEYGQPFISKHVSEMISRLQKHNFQFKDKSFEELYSEYPKCKCALEWFCNKKFASFNINNNKWLKEFLCKYPPEFSISNKCCKYGKKDVGISIEKEKKYDLTIIGIRKAEGGVRRSIKSCFNEGDDSDVYRPVFWYKNNDKEQYDNHYSIEHSKCYSHYGLKRTGCCGCPFGRDFEFELNVIKDHEPNLFKAVNNIFKDSYEYTRKYKQFCEEMDSGYGSYANYLRIKEKEIE